MSASLKLISLNIERSKHLDRALQFLRQQRPEILCLQELMEYDIPRFEEVCGPCFFAPATRHRGDGRPGVMGTGMCSRLPIEHRENIYYLGRPDDLRDFDLTNTATKHASESRAVSLYDVEKEGVVFRVGTTHFTWTPDGSADDFQRADMQALLSVLAGLGEFVLTGDFNAPRGGEIFAELASRYTDNVPAHYTTSIDPHLHRAGALQLMVDGIFSTPAYAVADVELLSGVSDHCAILATIAKTG